MERGISDKTILEEFIIDFVKVAERHVKYIIVSGFVAIAHGRSRATEDIDMIIERMPKDKFIEMHKALDNSGFECMQSANPEVVYDDYLINGDSVRYTRKGEFVPEMEIKFVKDSLDEQQIKTRQKLGLTGLDVYFSSINMNIAFKEGYLKTPKDLEDARHLRIIYKESIDENEINRIKKEIERLRMKNER